MNRCHIEYLLAIFFMFFVAFTACSKEDETAEKDPPQTNINPSGDNENNNNENDNKDMNTEKIIITVGNQALEVELAENSSVDSLVKVLKENPVTVQMNDYGNMEKVGSLGQNFPRNDTQITTEAGDVILYQGNMLVIYYAPNSWSFTRLGKIKNVSTQSLKDILGDGDVTVVLSLPSE